MKKILVLHFSQTGQLTEILNHLTEPLLENDLDFVSLSMKRKFPFPWNADTFFNEMPETVLEKGEALDTFQLKHAKYDLILFGYQPWFLSPSLPASSILQNPMIQKVMENTPVVTVIGARNMWLNAQESVKKMILANQGQLVGNLAFIDENNNLASAVSILHWMLKGKKEKKWGIFPKPGVSDEHILGASKFGLIIAKILQSEKWDQLQPLILLNQGVKVPTNILFIEQRAKIIFKLWAKLIVKKEEQGRNRIFWVRFFKYYLVFALFIVAPIVLFVYNLFIRPFSSSKIKQKKTYFCGITYNNQ